MFAQLILPLRDHRSLRIVADYAEETATEYRRHVYEFEDADVIALEGIYLLKACLPGPLRPVNLDRVQLRNSIGAGHITSTGRPTAGGDHSPLPGRNLSRTRDSLPARQPES